jgi:hypothetical protein
VCHVSRVSSFKSEPLTQKIMLRSDLRESLLEPSQPSDRKPRWWAGGVTLCIGAALYIWLTSRLPRLPVPSSLMACDDGGAVFVIRHGEKSSQPLPGSPEELGLNATGWKRAHKLPQLVETGAWPRFTHIFASSPRGPNGILRERQTVEPLAEELGILINDTFAKEDTEALASATLQTLRVSCGARVLISWEHCRNSWLLMALGCSSSRCRACWGDGVYDAVYELRYPKSKTAATPSLRVSHEGFATDVQGLDGYQCASGERLQHTRCELPDGRWIGTQVHPVDIVRGQRQARDSWALARLIAYPV